MSTSADNDPVPDSCNPASEALVAATGAAAGDPSAVTIEAAFSERGLLWAIALQRAANGLNFVYLGALIPTVTVVAHLVLRFFGIEFEPFARVVLDLSALLLQMYGHITFMGLPRRMGAKAPATLCVLFDVATLACLAAAALTRNQQLLASMAMMAMISLNLFLIVLLKLSRCFESGRMAHGINALFPWELAVLAGFAFVSAGTISLGTKPGDPPLLPVDVGVLLVVGAASIYFGILWWLRLLRVLIDARSMLAVQANQFRAPLHQLPAAAQTPEPERRVDDNLRAAQTNSLESTPPPPAVQLTPEQIEAYSERGSLWAASLQRAASGLNFVHLGALILIVTMFASVILKLLTLKIEPIARLIIDVAAVFLLMYGHMGCMVLPRKTGAKTAATLCVLVDLAALMFLIVALLTRNPRIVEAMFVLVLISLNLFLVVLLQLSRFFQSRRIAANVKAAFLWEFVLLVGLAILVVGTTQSGPNRNDPPLVEINLGILLLVAGSLIYLSITWWLRFLRVVVDIRSMLVMQANQLRLPIPQPVSPGDLESRGD